MEKRFRIQYARADRLRVAVAVTIIWCVLMGWTVFFPPAGWLLLFGPIYSLLFYITSAVPRCAVAGDSHLDFGNWVAGGIFATRADRVTYSAIRGVTRLEDAIEVEWQSNDVRGAVKSGKQKIRLGQEDLDELTRVIEERRAAAQI